MTSRTVYVQSCLLTFDAWLKLIVLQNENPEILSKWIQLDWPVQPSFLSSGKQPVCHCARRKWYYCKFCRIMCLFSQQITVSSVFWNRRAVIKEQMPYSIRLLVLVDGRIRPVDDFLWLWSVLWVSFCALTLLDHWHKGHLINWRNNIEERMAYPGSGKWS